jgi:hypothetical protein
MTMLDTVKQLNDPVQMRMAIEQAQQPLAATTHVVP